MNQPRPLSDSGTMPAVPADAARPVRQSGLVLALAASMAFGLSGTLARGLLDAGWTAGAAVMVRVALAAAVLAVPAIMAIRGDWALVRDNAKLILFYGVVPVAGTQLCYFYAVDRLPVGIALLIEFTAPVAVVLWLWWRRGQRPSTLTAIGAAIAAGGLVLLLDIVGGGGLSLAGVLWAFAAMLGAATYFILSAEASADVPPITLAGAGLLVGAVTLGLAGASGVLPIRTTTADVAFRSTTVPWWVVMGALGVVATAFAYATGIAAVRRLGSRLSSFIALTEVVAALAFAWLLLDQVPRTVQFVGAALIFAGVVVVKLGEPADRTTGDLAGDAVDCVFDPAVAAGGSLAAPGS